MIVDYTYVLSGKIIQAVVIELVVYLLVACCKKKTNLFLIIPHAIG